MWWVVATLNETEDGALRIVSVEVEARRRLVDRACTDSAQTEWIRG